MAKMDKAFASCMRQQQRKGFLRPTARKICEIQLGRKEGQQMGLWNDTNVARNQFRIEELNRQIAAANAKKLATPATAAGGDVAALQAEWAQLVKKFQTGGRTQGMAAAAARRENPQLWRKMMLAANAGRPVVLKHLANLPD